MNVDQKDLEIILNNFYNFYFVDYLEEILDDSKDELSAILLIEGIDYFFDFCNKYQIDIPFTDLKSYLEQNYIDYEEIYKYIMDKYKNEVKEFGKGVDFERLNKKIEY